MKTSLHNNMKKLFVLGMLVIMVMTCPQHTYAQNVGINNASPDVSAALDVKSGSGLNQGILPTFVDLATATFPSPGPANGLFVHNSNSAYGQGTGIYQNVGTAAAPIWLKQLTRNDAWYLFGNRITSAGIPATYGTSKIPSGNWLGAANAADLVFGTDSIERARITSAGLFGIGLSAPTKKFQIAGGTTATSNFLLSLWSNCATCGNLLTGTGIKFTNTNGANEDNGSAEIYAIRNIAGGSGDFIIRTSTGTPTMFERFRVAGSTGFIGINASSTNSSGFIPNSALHIQSTSTTPPQITLGIGGNPNVGGLFGSITGRTDAAGGPADATSIKFEADAGWPGAASATDIPSRMTFWTTLDGTGTQVERMRIDNAGNVGINKVPIYKLDVENGTDRSYFHAGTAGSTESYVTLARSNFEGVNAFAYNDDAIEGTTSNALYNAFYGKNSNAGGDAIWGQNTAATGTGVGAGVVGITAQSGTGSAGVWGENSNTTGTGTVGAGQGQAGSVLINGSGGAFTGNTTGAYVKSNAAGNYALQVNGTGNGTYTTTATPLSYWGLVVGAGGQLSTAATFTVSDKRFKKDITTLPIGTLQKVLQLNPCNYHYNAEKYPLFKGDGKKQVGFLAQEVEQIFPELVTNQKYMPDPTFDPATNSSTETKNNTSKKNVNSTADKEVPQVKGYYAVDYVSLIPYLVKAIQEQQLIIESLKAEIDELKAK